MAKIWTYNKSYAHCFFVLPLALYMVWLNRGRLAQITPRPSGWGLASTIASGMAWYVAHVGAIQIGEHLSLVAMTISLVWAMLGGRVVRALAFPLAFLFLVVPFGEGLFPILISVATKSAVAVLHLMGVPVANDGYYIRLENGEWKITEACSGLRFILSIITVGAVYSYTSYRRWWKRVAFLVAGVTAAILVNAFRVWLLVMIGLYTSMQSPIVRDHVPLGWAIFAAMVIVIFALGRLWMDPDDVADRPIPPERGSGVGSHAAPVFVRAAVLGVALIALWPPLGSWMDHRKAAAPGTLIAPGAPAAWQPIESMPWDWRPHYVGFKTEVRQAYEGASGPVGLYAALYRDQRQGAELIRVENGLPTPFDITWRYTPSARREVPGLGMTVDEIDVRSIAMGFRVWRWYWVRGRTTTEEGEVKIDGIVSKILGRNDDAAVIVIYAPFGKTPEDASASLAAFAKQMKPRIDAMVATAATNR